MKVEQVRWVKSDFMFGGEPTYLYIFVYTGDDPLHWCLKGCKNDYISSWVNGGFFDGENPLCYYSHKMPWKNKHDDPLHDWICIGDPWEEKYANIFEWGWKPLNQ